MAGFDAELRASIRDLQSAVTALSAETQKANASLRQTQAEVKGVAAGHREAAIAAGGHAREAGGVAEQVHGIGRAARFAGGEGGALVGHLSHLVAINPLAIAAGLGIGFITTQIAELIEKAKQGSKELEELLKKPDELAKKVAGLGREGLLGLDSKGLRQEALGKYLPDEAIADIDPEFRDRAIAAAHGAVKAGRAGSVTEGLDRLKKARALRRRESGFGDAIQITDDQLLAIAAGSDQAGFGDAFRRSQGTSEYALAEESDFTKTAASQQAKDKARAQAGLAGDNRTVGLLTEIKNLLERRNTAAANGDQIQAKIIEGQMQERTASLDQALSQYASSSK